MLKKIVALVPLFSCLLAVGQDQDFSFIKRSSVTWAADVSAGYQFTTPNVSLALRQQVAAGKLKVFIPGDHNEDVKATAAAVRDRIAPSRTMTVVDENGNSIETVREADDPLFASKYFNEQTNTIVLLKQLLYIRDGNLKIYVPRVSPKYSVITSWGEELGQAPAFSTARNKCLKIPRSRSRMRMFDSAASIVINLDTTQTGTMVKQLYSQNFVQALWPHLKRKKYDFFLTDCQQPVAFDALNMGIVNGDATIKVPVYDSLGNLSSYATLPPAPLDISLFTKVLIKQVIYFSVKKNRFYSEPRELVFYARRWVDAGWEAQPSPVLNVTINGR